MTEVALCDALAAALRQILQFANVVGNDDHRAPAPGSLRVIQPRDAAEELPPESTEIHVFNGFVPLSSEVQQQVPFVSILPQRLQVTAEYVAFEVNLDLCAFAPTQTPHGQLDILNLVHRIYASLFAMPDRTLDERYLLAEGIEVVFDPTDYRPYQHAVMTTTWHYKAPFALSTNLELNDYD